MVYMVIKSEEDKKNYWGAVTHTLGIDAEDSRAFCPGASPPDNSCSPPNKGTGSSRSPAPSPPKPSSGKVAADDARGHKTGHTAQQRREYGKQLDEWLAENHGVTLINWGGDFSDESMQDSPPSMDSFMSVASGIEKLDSLGMTKPKVIKFDESLPPTAFAAYEYWSGDVSVAPDTDRIRMELAVRLGAFAGNGADDLLVHEMSHHDHFEHMQANIPSSFQGKDSEAVRTAVHDRVAVMFGMPDEDGVPTADPWTRSGRFSRSAKNADGKPLDPDEARDIASEVSRYAMTNPLEFIAEVRTGVSTGAAYSQEVMSLYEDYMGPPLVKPASGKKRAA